MSYNIDSIDVVYKKGFCITRTKLEQLEKEAGNVAEGNIFDMLRDAPRDGYFERIGGPDGVEIIAPHAFWWYGEGSGRSEDTLIWLLAHFEGEADLVLTWEGGDSHSGLRLRNGVVTKHEAVLALGDEIE